MYISIYIYIYIYTYIHIYIYIYVGHTPLKGHLVLKEGALSTSEVFNSRAYRCPSDDWLKSMVLVDPNPDAG